MNLQKSLLWMFFGSIFIGVFINAMNILANKFDDLYFSAPTLIYSALFMASNMCILEILMYYDMHKEFKLYLFICFVLFSFFCVFLLRQQLGVNDNGYLKRMISHHSTAITTSKEILKKTNSIQVAKIAKDIISTQIKEINLMKNLL
mgnify:CR=1 FL=1|jgi:hypothetical protein